MRGGVVARAIRGRGIVLSGKRNHRWPIIIGILLRASSSNNYNGRRLRIIFNASPSMRRIFGISILAVGFVCARR